MGLHLRDPCGILVCSGSAEQPITLRRWLAIGTMPHVECGGIGYVLQADVDAFNEACQCRNQKVYRPKALQTVAF